MELPSSSGGDWVAQSETFPHAPGKDCWDIGGSESQSETGHCSRHLEGGMLSDKPHLPMGITQCCAWHGSAGGAGWPGHTGVLGTVPLLYPGCL